MRRDADVAMSSAVAGCIHRARFETLWSKREGLSLQSHRGHVHDRRRAKAGGTGHLPRFREAKIVRSPQQFAGLEWWIKLSERHDFACRDPARKMVQCEFAGVI